MTHDPDCVDCHGSGFILGGDAPCWCDEPAPEPTGGNLPPRWQQDVPPPPDQDAAGLAVTVASEVATSRATWLWDRRIPAGELTLVSGRGGLGKTVAVGASLAAKITRGQLDGDGLDGPAQVVIASAEDSLEHTLVPRLHAAGAILSRVGFVTDPLELPDDCPRLEAAIRKTDAKVLILDPLNAFLGFSIDSHNDKDLRRALGPLSAVAHDTDCTIVAIGHVNKTETDDAYRLVSGSVGYFNAARSVLLVARDPEADTDDDPRRVLVHGKTNLGQYAPPLRFTVESTIVTTDDGEQAPMPLVVWGDEDPDLTTGDVLGSARAPTKRERAGRMLRKALADGPRLVDDLKALADDADIGWRTVETAKADEGIEARQIKDGPGRGPGPSWWKIPAVGEWPAPEWSAEPVHTQVADHSNGVEPPETAESDDSANGPQPACVGCGHSGQTLAADDLCLVCSLAGPG